jgi:heme/copper-type cytochrome/quinol oxidase subunit 2
MEVLIVLFVVGVIILWISALVDVLKNEFRGYNKIIWLLALILLPVLGMIFYFCIGRGQKIAEEK